MCLAFFILNIFKALVCKENKSSNHLLHHEHTAAAKKVSDTLLLKNYILLFQLITQKETIISTRITDPWLDF